MKVASRINKLVPSVLVTACILAAVLVIGCANADSGNSIDLALANFAKAYETKDIDLLKGCLVEESSFYSELLINAQNTFARHEKIEMEFSNPTINLYEDGKRATVGLKETFKRVGRDGKITEEISSNDIFELIKSEAGWKIISWYRDIYMRELPNEGREKE